MQRRSHRSLHSEDDPVTVRTPSKRASEIARADARAIPAPPTQPRASRARRQATKPQQPDSDDDDDSSARSAVAPAAAAAVAHTPRRTQRSSFTDDAATPASPSRSSIAQPASAEEIDDPTADLHSSVRFQLLRSALLVVVFLLLYTFAQRYILEPTFQPHRTEAYKRNQEAQLRAQIAANICPAGQECEYDLGQDWKLKRT